MLPVNRTQSPSIALVVFRFHFGYFFGLRAIGIASGFMYRCHTPTNSISALRRRGT